MYKNNKKLWRCRM